MFFNLSITPTCLLQTDIAGFCSQVEHERILQSIEIAVHRDMYQHGQTFESLLQARAYQKERVRRVFRGQWRAKTKMYRSVRVRDIVPICKFLLDHSFL